MLTIGQIVWKSGGAWDIAKPVEVTEDNIGVINDCFGSFYFATLREAEIHTDRCHGEYGNYLNRVYWR